MGACLTGKTKDPRCFEIERILVKYLQESTWSDVLTFKRRMEVDHRGDDNVENGSLKLLPLSEGNFNQLNKLEEIAYFSKILDAIYHLRKLRNVFSTA